MRQFVNGNLYKVAIGVGLLVLVVLVAANIWLWQSDDSGPASGASQGSSSGSDVPGFPNRSGDTNSSSAVASDSADLEINREGSVSGSELISNDGATVSDLVQIEVTGSDPESIFSDAASVGDSAVTEVGTAPVPPPPSGGGGTTNTASVTDTADLVVRDAEGNIKNQETVK